MCAGETATAFRCRVCCHERRFAGVRGGVRNGVQPGVAAIVHALSSWRDASSGAALKGPASETAWPCAQPGLHTLSGSGVFRERRAHSGMLHDRAYKSNAMTRTPWASVRRAGIESHARSELSHVEVPTGRTRRRKACVSHAESPRRDTRGRVGAVVGKEVSCPLLFAAGEFQGFPTSKEDRT
jgi:hypothetical protein